MWSTRVVGHRQCEERGAEPYWPAPIECSVLCRSHGQRLAGWARELRGRTRAIRGISIFDNDRHKLFDVSDRLLVKSHELDAQLLSTFGDRGSGQGKFGTSQGSPSLGTGVSADKRLAPIAVHPYPDLPLFSTKEATMVRRGVVSIFGVVLLIFTPTMAVSFAYDSNQGFSPETWGLTGSPDSALVDVRPTDAARATSLQLLQSFPNPSSEGAMLRFAVPVTGMTTLRVYDIQGRLVRTLASGFLRGGPRDARWDGRDTAGSRVKAGVYLYRLDSASGSLSRKLIWAP